MNDDERLSIWRKECERLLKEIADSLQNVYSAVDLECIKLALEEISDNYL